MKNSNKGFTLIELLIVMALMGIIMTIAFSILQFTNISLNLGTNEYNEQAAVRLALEKVNSIVRYSNALFAIPKASFREENLTAKWNYIGIRNVVTTPAANGNPAVMGSEIVQYTYDTVTKTHITDIVLPAKPGFIYKFFFKKTTSNIADNLLQFTIQTFFNGSTVPKDTIVSQLEALNALQVIDFGTTADQSIAVAYRLDERLANTVGHLAMVLDTSGSMAWNLDGETLSGKSQHGGDSDLSRLDILKSEAIKLINGFAQQDNIDIALVPFSDSANNPKPFRNARLNTQSLIDDVDSLTTVGGTNTGDGIRRAYYALQNDPPSTGLRASNYMVILVDGVTTFATAVSNSNRSYYTGVLNINEGYLDRSPINTNGQIVGNGSELDPKGKAYVNLFGNMVKNNNFAKVYVIGFSSLQSDLESVADIAASCGALPENVFTAGSSDDLSQVLTEIGQDIVNDLWYIQGPGL